MRHSAATELEQRDALRVLLIGGQPEDRALVEAAAARIAVGTTVRTPLADTPADDHAGLDHAGLDHPGLDHAGRDGDYDAVLVGCGVPAAAVARWLDRSRADDRRRPMILLTRDEAGAEDARRRGIDAVVTGDASALAAAIGAGLARAARALADELAERRRTESAARRSEARARMLVLLSDAARNLDNPEDIAQASMRILRETLSADRCVYADIDPDSTRYTYTAVACAPGVSDVTGRYPIPPGSSTVLRGTGPIVVDDAEQTLAGDEAARSLFRAVGIRGAIVAPLMKGGRIAAAAGVHMLTPRRWTADEVELVDVAAERLWQTMELARVTRALRESERDFRGLFELSAVGAAQSDPVTGRFLRANRRFREITGYSEEELYRLTFTDLTHPDDRDANTGAIGAVVRGEADRWDIEKRYLRRDGSSVWVHVSGQLMRDASGRPYRLIAHAVDITDRKRAEAALIASRRQLQLVTDSAPVLIANCGADYRYKFVNRAYADRYRISPRDIVGKRVCDVLGDEAFAQLKSYADSALAGERSEFELEVHYRDIGRQWIRCAYAPERDDFGHPVGWVAAIIDITDRKRAEEALREADRRKDEFLAVLGHELRNPLAPLRAGIELLKEAGRRPELLESLRAMMERQLAHLIHLVDDLLDLARVTRGTVQLQKAPLDLRAVIDAAVELGMPSVSERQHRLDVDVGPVPLPVEGDFQRLTQVIGNLLSNAAKYTEPGGEIGVRAGIEDGIAAIRVRDNGYGIPPERLEYIFEMFSQVPEHRLKTGGGGIGIGLALSRQLVTLHGGTVAAESAGLGLGSEFIVRLPLADHDAADQAGHRSEEAGATRRVLVVDDNRDAAESLRLVLELEGHVVEAVHGPAEALRAIDAFRPEVVLLDIGLPDMDGYEVARRIRARPDGAGITLLALTGWAQEEDKQRAYAAGFDEHLTKPVDHVVLRRLITMGPLNAPGWSPGGRGT